MKPQDRTRATLESGLPSTAKLVAVAIVAFWPAIHGVGFTTTQIVK